MLEQYDYCLSFFNNDSCKGEFDFFEYIFQCFFGDVFGVLCDGS